MSDMKEEHERARQGHFAESNSSDFDIRLSDLQARYKRLMQQSSRSRSSSSDEPSESKPIFEPDNLFEQDPDTPKPRLSAKKNPLFSAKKNPLFSAKKNPLFSDEPNPRFSDEPNPLFSTKKTNPLFSTKKNPRVKYNPGKSSNPQTRFDRYQSTPTVTYETTSQYSSNSSGGQKGSSKGFFQTRSSRFDSIVLALIGFNALVLIAGLIAIFKYNK
jgi:hypothetical protein